MVRVLARVSVCLLLVWGSISGRTISADRSSAGGRAAAGSHPPLIFEANTGQSDPAVSFLARGRGYRLWLSGSDATLALSGPDAKHEPSVVRMRLDGARRGVRAGGDERLPTRVNYLVGNDPAKWHRDVPAYARVHIPSVYPGVDIAYYGNEGRLDTTSSSLRVPMRAPLRFASMVPNVCGCVMVI